MARPPIKDFLHQSQSQISDPVCHIPVRGEIWQTRYQQSGSSGVDLLATDQGYHELFQTRVAIIFRPERNSLLNPCLFFSP